MKRLEKKLNGNNTKLLCAILNRFWEQHPIKQKLYGHLPPIPQAIFSYGLLHMDTPVSADNQKLIYQLCADIGGHLEDFVKSDGQ